MSDDVKKALEWLKTLDATWEHAHASVLLAHIDGEKERIDAALLIGWRAGARAQRKAAAGEHVKAHTADFEQMHAALRSGEHHE